MLQYGKESRKVTRTITMFELTADLQNCNNAEKSNGKTVALFLYSHPKGNPPYVT